MIEDHKQFLRSELEWLGAALDVIRKLNAEDECDYSSVFDVTPPDHLPENVPYAQFIAKHDLSFAERFLIVLAIVPHAQPSLLDTFKVGQHPPADFGGIIGSTSRAFIPTGQTFLFLLGGTDLTLRFELMQLFHREHFLRKTNVLGLSQDQSREPEMSGVIKIEPEYLDLFIYGRMRKPDLSADFPAKLITTEMEWRDLVLRPQTKVKLQEIETWIEHFPKLWENETFRKRNKPGLRCLFTGPPGTGKTLAATLLGKKLGRDVYRIDLSTVVSKYIGETEKNLSRLFDRAEHKDWILFFDEADALFGKRTGVSDAHDRFANQEVSYLLQRVEYFDGLVILASNMKQNIDAAFLRRFQSIVEFPNPDAQERITLWKMALPGDIALREPERLSKIIASHNLTGAHITNISAFCCIQAARSSRHHIDESMLLNAIKRELQKEDRTM